MGSDDRKRRRDDEEERPPKKKGGSPILLIALVGGGLFLLLAVCGGSGVGVYFFMFRGERKPNDAGGPGGEGGAGGPVPRVNVSKAHFDKVEAGMSLEEVQEILGPAKKATQDDMKAAFGERAGGGFVPASDQWMANGRQAGVTSWQHWQSGREYIFVGFARGNKTGKDRAVLSFMVQPFAGGFKSDPGILAFGPGDPDLVAEDRDKRTKLLTDPKWNRGDPKTLIVGKWRTLLNNGYDFNADGTYAKAGPGSYSNTYRFTAADRIELTIPGDRTIDGRPSVQSYKVLVAQDEMILLLLPGKVLLNHKRVK